jgi:hypothetical protein
MSGAGGRHRHNPMRGAWTEKVSDMSLGLSKGATITRPYPDTNRRVKECRQHQNDDDCSVSDGKRTDWYVIDCGM